MAFLITSFFIFSIAVVSIESCGKSSVTLVNNGYREVLIGISEKVAENPQLIDKIKEIFTEASQFLYEATRRRAFFEEVKILIPSNWTSYPNATPSTDGISRSDFFIGNPDSQKDILGLADVPFVVKATGCGEPGNFIHLTPNYILNETIGKLFGPYGKTLVHEWAHYRWGVYDEYPVDESEPQFYAAENGIYEGTRCSLASPGYEFNPINGTGCAYIDGKPEPDCIWKDQETGVVGRQSSLMYKHSLYHVLEFCDNDETNKFTLHNTDAPTQQNKQCNGKSVWEVMKEHVDFANGANLPRKLPSTQPEFKIVQVGMRTKRSVLVLDKSGSMGSDSPTRMEVLRQVCNNYITNWIPDGEELAVVTFDYSARVVQDLTVVSSDTKPSLLNAIPSNPGGNTAIGQGLLAALDVLAEGKNLEGGNIILVSDGQQNVDPEVEDVLPQILAAKVVVHTIAISVLAEQTMEEPARLTGGSSFFLSTGQTASNAINEALRDIAQTNLDEDQKDIGLDSTAISLRVGETVLRSAVIDSTLGLNTKFIFDHSSDALTFTVRSPSGDVYHQNTPAVNCNPTFRVCSLYIDNIAEAGTWTYSVTNSDTTSQRVAITVTSQSSGTSEPISAQAFWGDSAIDLASGTRKQVLYASVSQGYTPILRADVLATVERPDGSLIAVQLKDSGTGADVIKDDGVYSAYFLAFTQNGRYGVQVTVNSTDVTTINHGRILGMSAGPNNVSGVQDIPVDPFQRQVTGGSFQLDNFTPGQPVYDPGRITDLQVTSINYTHQTVALEWTAVGNELDQGQASSYELRYATSFASLRNNFSSQAQVTSEMILNNKTLDEPKLSGEKEMFTIIMPSGGNITYVFGVTVWDTNGRNAQSPLSNLVSASMLFREHPAPPLPGSNVDDSQNPDPDNAQTATEEPSTVNRQPGISGGGSETTTTPVSVDQTDEEERRKQPNMGPIIRPGSNTEKINSAYIIAMTVGLTVSVLALVGGIFLIVKHHGKRKFMHNEEYFSAPGTAGMRAQPVTIPMEQNRRSSFPLRFPRFFPGLNQRPREYSWREVERRPTNELPPDIIPGNGLGLYDDLL